MSKTNSFFFGNNDGNGTQQNGNFETVNIYNPGTAEDEESFTAKATCNLSAPQVKAFRRICERLDMGRSTLLRGGAELILEFDGPAERLGMTSLELLEEAARFYLDFRKNGNITEEMTRKVLGRAMARAMLRDE